MPIQGPFHVIVDIVPKNIINAMAEGDMLAIIFFSVLFGLGVAAIGERGKPVLAFFQGVADFPTRGSFTVKHLLANN